MNLEELRDAPWDTYSWEGEARSLDGTKTSELSKDDVSEILYYGDTGADWDGKCAGVARLKDGRLIAWESWWGPTGSGFSQDAYGGDADVFFACDLNLLIRMALSDEGRRLCGLPAEVA